jgi:hypothetical protein
MLAGALRKTRRNYSNQRSTLQYLLSPRRQDAGFQDHLPKAFMTESEITTGGETRRDILAMASFPSSPQQPAGSEP